MYKHFLFSALLIVICPFVHGQDDWKLKSDKDNIKTYSKKLADSKINAVKIESVFPCSVSQFVSVLMDVDSYDDWIYNSKSTRLIKKVSPAELYYYSEVAFPWPTANRDFVSHVVISQDPRTKIARVDAKNVSGLVPAKPNLVRIEKSSGTWVITPQGPNQVKIEYILQVDPGGDLPAWLINPFASKGLVETFKNLRKQLSKPEYVSARPPFIVE
ncbi:lipid-binding protein [Sediminibacterium roseum]|uniref:Lipid-binding protein n=1 Tax=Sediminibacterium roseum TaxID=1978412 RepID=A0ABW9ZP76_9BACT|nr:START domain-containing protein [Sediminibacterium roseum]NCI48330.1 lipid-binding protein [Sediminibacterium roseum]